MQNLQGGIFNTISYTEMNYGINNNSYKGTNLIDIHIFMKVCKTEHKNFKINKNESLPLT